MDDTNDALRRLGDRLEWVFPLPPADEMVELIGPLFREEIKGASRPPRDAAPISALDGPAETDR